MRRLSLVVALPILLLALPVAVAADGPVEPQSGEFRIDADGFNYTLHEGAGKRICDTEIMFMEPFPKVPKVTLKVTAIEAKKKNEKRYKLKVHKVWDGGFILRASCWSDAQITAIEGTWEAKP